MEVAVGETQDAAFGLTFDRRLKSKITSDGGLLACRELDDVLGLSKVAGEVLTDTRTGANGRHTLQGQFRQSVFGRLAGYEDLNDADRLADDPAMRWVVGGRAVTQKAASTSQMGRFETEVMSDIPPHRTACMDTVDPEPAQVRQCRQVLGLIHGYVIRLPANAVLQRRIAHLLTRPVGRPPHEVRRFYASFRYQAQSWSHSRRVVAKVEWHPGELYPRVGFLVTNLCRPPERVVAFYNGRGTAEQWIREGKNAAKWTRLSCRSRKANAVRLLHALVYNLANFFRTLVLPDEVERWSLTRLREKVVKIGAKVVTHARYTVFQMAEVAVPRALFGRILAMIYDLRPKRVARC